MGLDLDGKLLAGSFNTIKAAMIAAQADYDARILAALEPQPDPRDEVIARLVEAATPFADESLYADKHHDFVTVKRSDCDAIGTALAAAKALQHD